ncbi:PAS domain-containing protein [Pseudoalteromonas sp. CO325X]|uniref:sensor histidine kinase n=1 Tax=Pseudoalteromonas TaxID=53246 RepID=UPI0010236AE7|nr:MULTISPECIES: ATP-binding protein [Pseudoalteromonas]RZF81824.1 PAS domain-containing protein [Pseudoalteromonas sp. CO325X]|tara:strand:- start:6762 stop:8057 length:1296 start_codon:yes stop_codon:yes gene_type:complete
MSANTKLSLLLAGVILTALGAQYSWYSLQLPALTTGMILVALACICSILVLFKRQSRQAQLALKALANGDSSLGLPRNHPMRVQYNEVKEQILQARLAAEQQAQFMQTLLIHIDMAVLVFDAQGNIIEQNPAVARLLGAPVKDLQSLAQLGEFISEAHSQCQSTALWQRGEQQDTLSIQISLATIQGQELKIVTLQSIHEQLLLKEQQAYKRLTRVLTHEIANSITPLSSLAHTCTGLLPQGLNFTDSEDKEDLALALQTLHSRTEGLSAFIARFRSISNLPKPDLKAQSLADVVTRCCALFKTDLEQQHITLELQTHSDTLVMCDAQQIEQVLINLIKNAIEAMSVNCADKTLSMVVDKNSQGQLYIAVCDTGGGISKQAQEMMFVPFFTTKQQGSGIGLALSKQIMVSHGGDLTYHEQPQGACLRCVFG